LDVSGRLVAVLSSKQLPPGEHAVTWDLRDAAGEPLPKPGSTSCASSSTVGSVWGGSRWSG